jgi:hypothetical protein
MAKTKAKPQVIKHVSRRIKNLKIIYYSFEISKTS